MADILNPFDKLVEGPEVTEGYPPTSYDRKTKEPLADTTQGPVEQLTRLVGRYAPSAIAAVATPGGPLAKLAQFGLMAGMETLIPSEEPMTELGAVVGSIAGGRGKAATTLTRMASEMIGTGVGASGGQVIDNLINKPDQVFDFNGDKIALYVATTPLAVLAGEAIKKGAAKSIQNPLMRDVGKVAEETGQELPFSVGQAQRGETGQKTSSGLTGMLERQFFNRSNQREELALSQSSKAKEAISTLLGVPKDDLLNTEKFAMEFFPGFKARVQALPGEVEKIITRVEKGNMSKAQAIDYVARRQDELGVKLLSTDSMNVMLSMKENMAKVGEDAVRIQKRYANLVAREPDNFLTFFVPRNESFNQHLPQLKTLMEIASPEEKQKIGSALIQRILRNGGAITDDGILHGGNFAKALKSFGDTRLKEVFGADKADALQSLGRVMSAFEPAETVAGVASDRSKGMGAYLSRRVFILGAGAAVGGGTALAGAGPMLAGAAGAGVVAIPLNTIVNHTLKNGRPFVNLLESALKGNAADGARVMRLIAVRPLTDQPEDFRSEQPARSRLRGWLKLGE